MPVKKMCMHCGSDQHYSAFCYQRPRKSIPQQGKQTRLWVTFRDEVARPYLDQKYGHVCAVKGCGATANLDVDHIKSRGAHSQSRFDVKNMQYLCRKHHIEKTGTPQWTRKS